MCVALSLLQAVAATKKVKAFGLVNFPLAALKKLHRAGINIATLELSGPLGMLEAADSKLLVAYCGQHGIKVLLADALVGGLLAPSQVRPNPPPHGRAASGADGLTRYKPPLV